MVVLDLTISTVSLWMSMSKPRQYILCSTKKNYCLDVWGLPSRQWENYHHPRTLQSFSKLVSIPQILKYVSKCFGLRFHNLSIISIPRVSEHFIITMPKGQTPNFSPKVVRFSSSVFFFFRRIDLLRSPSIYF